MAYEFRRIMGSELLQKYSGMSFLRDFQRRPNGPLPGESRIGSRKQVCSCSSVMMPGNSTQC